MSATSSRRAFLATTAALAASAASPVSAADPPAKLNFLFIYTDDQRWDSLGVVQREQGERGRFPWVKTPNLDRLAAEGVRFRNAFVVNALCAPSRATFLTGCYGHINGIVNNHTPFPQDSVSHASLLRQAGYATGYIGKFHMGAQRGQRPGFDYSASFIGQGKYFDCPFEVNGKETPTKGWVDDVSTDYAMSFIRENKSKPFLLVVGYKTTHGPFEPPPRFANLYAGEEARTVPNLDSSPPFDPPADAGAARLSGRPTVPTNLGYFRCISAMDENVGKLLNLLDELKLAENTMVIFASDNGFYLGEHRRGDKRSAYEESIRIPLILRCPRVVSRPAVIDKLALNIDLAPTILDYAGVQVPARMQGRSWRQIIEGNSDGWRSAFFYDYFYENGFNTPTTLAVRTDSAKLIKYPGHDEWTELFDLAKDPYEMRNLIKDPAAAQLRAQLEAEFDSQARAIAFRIPEYADDPAKDRPGEPLNAWVLDYRFDADQGDKVIDASGRNNHGAAKGVALVDGRDARKARRFDGKGNIAVPLSNSLSPAVVGYTIEVTCRPETAEGVLVAMGGDIQGVCLYLDGGRLAFTVNSRRRSTTIRSREAIPLDWCTITAAITANQQLTLLVDGQQVAQRKLQDWIRQTPKDAMQIGADMGAKVVAEKAIPPFTGLIERVRIRSGEVR